MQISAITCSSAHTFKVSDYRTAFDLGGSRILFVFWFGYSVSDFATGIKLDFLCSLILFSELEK